ncbi:299_t:CDS:1 [Dentiscutata erythropus]|uniref:299_t:CDS:1 n=1 Tax=Dentiscutata erythropus TaxID=1348616 RepID=A0A9N9J9L6_9GLOM|nr:299_t:CDS:1 [Dentiscutata erythropus]
MLMSLHWCCHWCRHVIVGVMLSVVKASWWILDERVSLLVVGVVGFW